MLNLTDQTFPAEPVSVSILNRIRRIQNSCQSLLKTLEGETVLDALPSRVSHFLAQPPRKLDRFWGKRLAVAGFTEKQRDIPGRIKGFFIPYFASMTHIAELTIRRLCGVQRVRARKLLSPEIDRPAQALFQTNLCLPSEHGLRL